MIPTNRLVGIREPETGSTNWEGRYCAFTTDLIVASKSFVGMARTTDRQLFTHPGLYGHGLGGKKKTKAK
jgi:hypothetical protein